MFKNGALKGGDVKLFLAISLFMIPMEFMLSASIFMFGTFGYFVIVTISHKGGKKTFNDINADLFAFTTTGDVTNQFAAGMAKVTVPIGGAFFITLGVIISLVSLNLIKGILF